MQTKPEVRGVTVPDQKIIWPLWIQLMQVWTSRCWRLLDR